MRKILAITLVSLFAVNAANAQGVNFVDQLDPVDPGFNFLYDPGTGDMWYHSVNSDQASTYEITSAGNLFIGDGAEYKSEAGDDLYKGLFKPLPRGQDFHSTKRWYW